MFWRQTTYIEMGMFWAWNQYIKMIIIINHPLAISHNSSWGSYSSVISTIYNNSWVYKEEGCKRWYSTLNQTVFSRRRTVLLRQPISSHSSTNKRNIYFNITRFLAFFISRYNVPVYTAQATKDLSDTKGHAKVSRKPSINFSQNIDLNTICAFQKKWPHKLDILKILFRNMIIVKVPSSYIK